MNGKTLYGLCDSGNLFRTVISEECLYKLGLTRADLKPYGMSHVSTAKKGAALEILGETKRPIKIRLCGSQKCYKIKVVVIKNLAHPINLSGPFFKKNKIDQIHSTSSLSALSLIHI